MWKSKWLYGVAMVTGFAAMFFAPLLVPAEWEAVVCGIAIGAVQIGSVVLAAWLWRERGR